MAGGPDEKFIKSVAKKTFTILDIEEAEISVAVVRNKIIRILNRKYRGKNKPTDVLSFGEKDAGKYFSVPKKEKYLGEIVISFEETKKEAREEGKSAREIFKKLLVHGILHLLGHEHEKGGAKEKKMFDMQEKILKNLCSK